MKHTEIVQLIFLASLLASCRSPLASPPVPTLTSPPSLQEQPYPDVVLLPTQPTLKASWVPLTPAAQTGEALPLTDPYSLAVQQPITDTIANWRPPLYPTPWIPTPYDHFLFTRPVLADTQLWALEDYRYGGVLFGNFVHTGIDIPLRVGSPVYAAGSGRVAWSGYGLLSGEYDPDDPYGLAVVIRHDFGYRGQTLYTVYGHLSETNLVIGQPIRAGDLIGLSGATGKVTGPHLHFEVRVGDNSFSRSRNPELWVVPPQGWGILVGQIRNFDDEPLRLIKVLVRSLESENQLWGVSYGEGPVNSDPYYNENFVIGDLPAGWYRIYIPGETSKHLDVKILPGRVSFFRFKRGEGFSTDLPPLEPPFRPPEATTRLENSSFTATPSR